MGPIERELRVMGGKWHRYWCFSYVSVEAWRVLEGAALELGLWSQFLETMDSDPDVVSEAIQAAEALGL